MANEDDERALVFHLDALAQAQSLDRRSVRAAAAEQCATEQVVQAVLGALTNSRN